MNQLSREARRVVELGRDGQGPTAAQRERVRAGLAAGIAAVGVTAGAGTAAAATASASAGGAAGATTATGSLLGIKLAIAAVVAVGAGIGGATVAVRVGAPPEAAPLEEPTAARAPSGDAAPIAVPSLEAAPRRVVIDKAASPRRVRAPGSGSGSGSGYAPRTEGERQVVEEEPPAPERAEPKRRKPPALDETKLLAIATDANRRKDYPSVLAATAMHAARYLRSSRALDRDSLRAIALCQTGRQEEGRLVLGLDRRWLSLPPARVNEILTACDVERDD